VAKATDFDPRVLKLFDGYVHGTVSRRQFIDQAAAFTVSSAAVLASLSPDYARAQQVDPGDASISVSYKKYASPTGGGEMRGYFARPAVIDHKLGFIAFGPDALWPLGGYPGNDDEGRAMQRERDGAEMVEDFVAAVEFLQKHPDSNGSVGSVGFCFGGGMSMQLAVRVTDLDAAVAFYGRHPSAEDTARIEVPLMLHHAGLDERVNAGWPDFEKALKANDKDYADYLYPDANHGFHNDTTPRFDEESATLAWQRTVEHFNTHLKTGAS